MDTPFGQIQLGFPCRCDAEFFHSPFRVGVPAYGSFLTPGTRTTYPSKLAGEALRHKLSYHPIGSSLLVQSVSPNEAVLHAYIIAGKR